MTKKYEMTNHDKENLLKMYNNNITVDKMYASTKIPRRQIVKYFKDNNLDLVKRYVVNNKYFNNIDSESKAYWLGYLYCDGYVGIDKYNNVSLSSIDENIINELSNELILSGNDKVKSIRLPSENSNNFSVNPLYTLSFSDKDIKNDLNGYNIFPNRKDSSFLNLSNISHEFYKYILFGMIDADGSVNKNKKVVSIYATKLIHNEYIKFIDIFNLEYRVGYNKTKDAYYIYFKKSDEYTDTFLKEYHDYSKIDRKKIAPSLS